MPLPFLLWAAVRFGPRDRVPAYSFWYCCRFGRPRTGADLLPVALRRKCLFSKIVFNRSLNAAVFFGCACGGEAKHRAARAQAAAIVESSNDAIIGCTFDGIITTWNHGAEKLYGYPAEEAGGQTGCDVNPVS
jgi:PAS domain-containing protein